MSEKPKRQVGLWTFVLSAITAVVLVLAIICWRWSGRGGHQEARVSADLDPSARGESGQPGSAEERDPSARQVVLRGQGSFVAAREVLPQYEKVIEGAPNAWGENHEETPGTGCSADGAEDRWRATAQARLRERLPKDEYHWLKSVLASWPETSDTDRERAKRDLFRAFPELRRIRQAAQSALADIRPLAEQTMQQILDEIAGKVLCDSGQRTTAHNNRWPEGQKGRTFGKLLTEKALSHNSGADIDNQIQAIFIEELRGEAQKIREYVRKRPSELERRFRSLLQKAFVRAAARVVEPLHTQSADDSSREK